LSDKQSDTTSVPERVQYKLGVVMYSCSCDLAPRYLTDLCASVQHLSTAASSIRYSAFFWLFRDAGSAHSVHGLLCGRLVALQLSTRQLERSRSWQERLQSLLKMRICTLYWSI